jgi:hypothetical protein
MHHQTLYIGAFFSVLTIFFIVSFFKHSAMERERVQTHMASFLYEFPVEEYALFRPFIEETLVPLYGKLPTWSPKRRLQQSTCTTHLFKLSEASKTFAKDLSDSAFLSIQTELQALHSNRCSNVIIQSMSAGFPKLTIALLILAPFDAEYFENIRFGYKWNPKFKTDNLILFLSVMRLSIIAPSLMVISKFLTGQEGKEFDFNVLSLPYFNFPGQTLQSLVDPELSKSHAVVHLDTPRPVTDLKYNFDKNLLAAIKAQGPELDIYTLKVDWNPGRLVLGIGQAMKLHGKDGKWYHLRAALLKLKAEVALLLYNAKLRIWTIYKVNGRVQTVPLQFAIRFITKYGTEICYSSE